MVALAGAKVTSPTANALSVVSGVRGLNMGAGLKLLIVEDDAHLRELLRAAAERTGKFSAIEVACDGHDAWQRIEAGISHDQLPDFVLSDLSMPRVDGIRLIRQLKTNSSTKHVPIAVMTSSDRPNDRENATRAGCCAFFHKPVRLGEFTTLIGSLPTISGDGNLVTSPKSG